MTIPVTQNNGAVAKFHQQKTDIRYRIAGFLNKTIVNA